MKQIAKQIVYLGVLLFIFTAPIQNLEQGDHNLEAANLETKTLSKILNKRQNFINRIQGRNVDKLVNILIVPGHDDEYVGTQFKGTTEVELTRTLGKKLYEYLSNTKGINVVLASDELGYNPIFEAYFDRDKKNIEEFIQNSKKKFSDKIITNDLTIADTNFHNTAPEEVAYRLYGINRWVNIENFDLVIHIHFNDYRGRKKNKIGKYDGFAIYTPGTFFDNHDLSRNLADSIFGELKKVQSISNLEEEKNGVIEDHELIALGENETLNAGSVLIEYGYIYENNLNDIHKRDITLDNFAYATYSGISKMMNEEPLIKTQSDMSISKNKTTTNNLIWQFQKAFEGLYPPAGKNLRDCPISGYFGKCSTGVK